MAVASFNDLKVVLVEPDSVLRDEIQAGLRSLGFNNIVSTGNLKMARDAFFEGDVRLLVGETKLPEGDLSDLIHQVRHQEIGDSPFFIAIALVSDLARAKKPIEAGADDVLLRPFNIEKLLERALKLADARKGFVVTTSYIGPNRRQKPRIDGAPIPCFNVPNPLHECYSGKDGSKLLRRAAARTLDQINRQKVVRHAFQVRWLVERIAPKFREKNRTGGGDADDHIASLYWTLKDLGGRVAVAGYGYAAYMIQTLMLMVDEIREFPDLAGEDEADHLDKLSLLILRACTPDKTILAVNEQGANNTTLEDQFAPAAA